MRGYFIVDIDAKDGETYDLYVNSIKVLKPVATTYVIDPYIAKFIINFNKRVLQQERSRKKKKGESQVMKALKACNNRNLGGALINEDFITLTGLSPNTVKSMLTLYLKKGIVSKKKTEQGDVFSIVVPKLEQVA